MKSLQPMLVFSRTKVNHLNHVKNLNLWGNELDSASICNDMPNIEIISLSLNSLTTLSDFEHCYNLKELYLRRNLIKDIYEVDFLTKLKNLRVLWLSDNPITNVSSYRKYVVYKLPQLAVLDDHAITEEERLQAKQYCESHPQEPPSAGSQDHNQQLDMGYDRQQHIFKEEQMRLDQQKQKEQQMRLEQQRQLDQQLRLERQEQQMRLEQQRQQEQQMRLEQQRQQEQQMRLEQQRQQEQQMRLEQQRQHQDITEEERQRQMESNQQRLRQQQQKQQRQHSTTQQQPRQERKQTSTQINILAAVLSLLNELDEDSLNKLKGRIDHILLTRSQKP